MQNAGLDESPTGIKTVGRNINSLRYTDEITIMARKWRGTKEPLDEGERGEWKKANLKLNIQKTKIMVSSPITSWQIEGEKVEAVTDFVFLGSKITVSTWTLGHWLQPWN